MMFSSITWSLAHIHNFSRFKKRLLDTGLAAKAQIV